MAVVLALPLQAQPPHDPPPGEYRVVDGRVDAGTFSGWRVYHTACHACHGVDGTGTDRAPDLVERVRTKTPRAFAAAVLERYRIVPPAGDDAEALLDEVLRRQRNGRDRLVMPAWDDDPRVAPHLLDLFAYLSARADGVLGPGRPAPLAEPARRR